MQNKLPSGLCVRVCVAGKRCKSTPKAQKCPPEIHDRSRRRRRAADTYHGSGSHGYQSPAPQHSASSPKQRHHKLHHSGLPRRRAQSRSTRSSQSRASRKTMASPTKSRAPHKAVYAYQAQEPDELTLSVGDEVHVQQRQEDGWWFGVDCYGRSTALWFVSRPLRGEGRRPGGCRVLAAGARARSARAGGAAALTRERPDDIAHTRVGTTGGAGRRKFSGGTTSRASVSGGDV